MPSLKDIAKACSVSVATVSKALNGHKDIGEETRRRICAMADEMGYMANSVARALKTNRTYNLGMLFVDERRSGLGHEYFSTILEGFKAEAESHGYDITFINSHVGEQPTSYVSHCRKRGLDGIVIACVNFTDPRILALVESNIPLVTIDHVFEGRTAILSDNINGVDTLVRYAYRKGHRKIAYLHGEDSAVTRGRLTGFHQACAELGLEIPEEYIIPCVYHEPYLCEEATRKLLQLPDPPTCILFPDDFSFIGGHNAMLEKGYTIPYLTGTSKFISCLGYDGINLARMMHLTTYTQNAMEIGRMAADRLIHAIEHPADAQPERILISGQLLEGISVEDFTE
ncbi:MAG: LacI family DNA-binding transcriptional regulator [Oscillospiraceae bacterium]|nr:LacI family DNA-binding transcriptional regulator [Oscillospiraceae bacterium]